MRSIYDNDELHRTMVYLNPEALPEERVFTKPNELRC